MSNEEELFAAVRLAPEDAPRPLHPGPLLAWLEGEGERLRRRAVLPPKVGDPAVRGWVHAGVCVLGGTLAGALFVCWLATVRSQATRVGALEGLRFEQVEEAAGARKAFDVERGRPAERAPE